MSQINRPAQGLRSDRDGLAALTEELQAAFAPHGLSLAATLSGYKQVIDMAYDVQRLSAALDFMNVMSYDFRGFWDGQTGHHSPLYPSDTDPNPDFNTVSLYNMAYEIAFYVIMFISFMGSQKSYPGFDDI